MKKIIEYLTVFIGLVLIAAGGCSRYRYDEPVQSLFIVESDLNFTAEGGTGTILARSDRGAITAASNQDWCTVSVAGMTVNVTAAPLSDISNRTALVTVSSGGQSQVVPVTQSAGRFILETYAITAGWDEGTYEVGYTSFEPVTVQATEDWITVREENGVIVIEVVKNPSNVDNRNGAVIVTCGNVTVSIDVNQNHGPFHKVTFAQMYGEWTLSYTDSLGEEQSFPVTFAKYNAAKLNVSGFPDEKQAQKMGFSSSTCDLTFEMGQWIYSITGVSKRFMVAVDSQTGDATGTATLIGKFNGQQHDQEYTFIDGGKWAGHTADGIAYGIYDNSSKFTGEYHNVMYNIKLSRTVP